MTLQLIYNEKPFLPIFSDSLVGQNFCYYAKKELIELRAFANKPNALSLISACYMDLDFVKKYLTNLYENDNFREPYLPYFCGDQIKLHKEKYLFTLGLIYYTRLTKENLFDKTAYDYVAEQLSESPIDSYELALLMLGNKRAIDIFDDKLLFANNYQRLMQTDFDKIIAQAVGGMPLQENSFAYAKSLWKKVDYILPKSIYYLTQLENLYGITMQNRCLYVRPNTMDILPSLSLYYCNKKVFVSFVKDMPRKMLLNGISLNRCFCLDDISGDSAMVQVIY